MGPDARRGKSMNSVLLLTAGADLSIRDALGVARTVFETSVNVA